MTYEDPFKKQRSKVKSANKATSRLEVVGFRAAGNGAIFGREFEIAKKKEDFKAQHGSVKVLWKDGKPVSTEPLSGD